MGMSGRQGERQSEQGKGTSGGRRGVGDKRQAGGGTTSGRIGSRGRAAGGKNGGRDEREAGGGTSNGRSGGEGMIERLPRSNVGSQEKLNCAQKYNLKEELDMRYDVFGRDRNKIKLLNDQAYTSTSAMKHDLHE